MRGRIRHWIRRAGLLGVLAVALVGAQAADALSPQRVVLKPAQVGAGYRLQVFPDGDHVDGQVTLDLCGFTFRSERLRTSRIQIAYVKPGAPLQLSNEVVTYERGGARMALGELRKAVKSCPHQAVTGPVKGVGPVRYRVTRIHGAGVPAGALALHVRIVGKINGRPADLRATFVYQIRGDTLSAVYAYGGNAESRRRLALHAAAASARNLRSPLES